MFLRQIFDPNLSQYAYLVGCQRTGEAVVIDPERDVDQYRRLASENGLRITAAAETHIHADFVSGTQELANDPQTTIYLSAEGGLDWQSEWAIGRHAVVPLHDGERFRVGHLEFLAMHTPGHTPEHMSYLVTDLGGGADTAMAAFTGDFIFVGDVGRPDLLESAAGQAGMMEPSARQLYSSLRQFASQPEYLQILPGHGAGSACGKALGAVPSTTLGYEIRFNPALRTALEKEQDQFVRHILEGQPEAPAYFARMKHVNKVGIPSNKVPQLRRLLLPEVLKRIGAPRFTVLDTRANRNAFLERHLPRSLYAPAISMFSNFAGSYLQPEDEVVLLVEASSVVDGLARQLFRMGFDKIEGYLLADDIETSAELLVATKTVKFSDVPALRRNSSHLNLLDVRRRVEFDTAHLPDAVNIAHTRLLPRIAEVPASPLLVHCATGMRAATASALLERHGRSVTCVNDAWENRPPALS